MPPEHALRTTTPASEHAGSGSGVLATIQRRLDETRIPGLDGIRALAVFLVILYHFGFNSVNGALGVEMFFTLSGFLITWILLKESRRTGGISFSAFYVRRSLRLFPAFYVYWAFGLVIYLLRGHLIPWGSVIASAFYLENYHAGLFPGESNFLSHTWSLAIEEQFYLLWPLLFWYHRSNLKRLTWVLISLIAGGWILRALLHLVFLVPQGYIYTAFETRLDQLAVGCLLAVVLARGCFSRLWTLVTMSPLLVPVVLALILASAGLHGHENYRFVLGYAIEPVLTAVLIVQLIYFADRWPGAIFNCAPISYLGRISYSLYLYQGLTLYTARSMTSAYPVVIQAAFAIGVTVLFGALSYEVVEQRLRSVVLKWLNSREPGRRRVMVPASPAALGKG